MGGGGVSQHAPLPLIHLFQTSGDISSGFQTRVGSLIRSYWQRPISGIHFLRFTSAMTPLLVYMASIVTNRFPHMHVSAGVGCHTG